MSSYNGNIPNATDIPAQSQPLLKLNFQYLQAFASVDHNFTGNSVSVGDGLHKKVTFLANGAAPGLTGGVSALFADLINGQSALWIQNAAGNFPITGILPSIGVNGYTCLPGGLMLVWGTRVNYASSTAINFTPNFTALFGIWVSNVFDAGASNVPILQVETPSNASFKIKVTNPAGGVVNGRTVYFLAIGTKT